MAAGSELNQYIQIALTAGLSIAGTYFVTWWSHLQTVRQDREEQTRLAKYLAAKLVTLLDGFIADCGAYVLDDGTPDQDGILSPTTDEPKFALPTDVDWRSIDPTMMYRAMSLPNEIRFAVEAISWYIEIAGPPDYEEIFEARKQHFSKVGLLALSLADDLRQKFSIPVRLGQDYREIFEREQARAADKGHVQD